MGVSSFLYEKIGISQQALGAMIGAKQSTLSHHDNDTRDLPSAASIALNDLILTAIKLPETTLPQPNDLDKAALLKEASWCNMQCYPLQKKLEKMKQQQLQATNMLAFIKAYSASHAEISSKIDNWLEILRLDATKKLDKNSWLAIKKLEINIQTLQQQAALYEAATID
ncbi:hypothetical protein ACFOW1_11710 [Parasediminibacterium paludis]|uniref:HTH cro/C1-type domain-containing protein n=1 Tax=Parasediminibacterium paludis TaxID=908966 RepID=A0ABV8PXE6_9BACT